MAVKCRRKGDAAVLSRDRYEYVVQKIDGLIKLVRGGGAGRGSGSGSRRVAADAYTRLPIRFGFSLTGTT